MERRLQLVATQGAETPPDDLEELAEEVAQDPVAQAAYNDAVNRQALVAELVEARKAARLTQAEVADRMGTTQSVISALESQRSDPRFSSLQRYARACGRAVVFALRDPATGLSPKWLPHEADPIAQQLDPQAPAAFGSSTTDDTSDDMLELAQEVRADPVAHGAYVDARRRDLIVTSLVAARKRLNYTQTGVVGAVGAGQSGVSDLENGRTDPRLSTLQRYARACQLELVAFLDEDAGMASDLGTQREIVAAAVHRTASVGVGAMLRSLIKAENQPGVALGSMVSTPELTPTTARRTAQSLASRGWLAYGDDHRLKLIPDAATFIGVSIRPDHVRGVVAGLDPARDVGEVYRLGLDDTSPRSVVDRVTELVERLLAEAEHPLGVGVELAGPVRGDNGTVVFAPDLQPHTEESWENYPLEAELQHRLGELKTVVGNDASALATRELLQHGDPGGLIVVTLSESTKGIGASLVLDGKIITGVDGQAGEIGHLRVPRNNRICPRCGQRRKGCLETIASGHAIAGELGVENLAAASLLAERGDSNAADAFRRGGRALGRVIGDAMTWLDAARVVIFGTRELAGGYTVASANFFAAGVTDGLAKRSLTKTDYPEYVTFEEWTSPQAAASLGLNDFLIRPLEYTNDMVARTQLGKLSG